MTKVTSNGVVVLENYYDAGSHRIAKAEVVGSSVTRFVYLYDGWDIVGLCQSGGNLYETYTRGVSLAGDVGGIIGIARHAFNQKYYVHNNHRGDVILMRMNALTLSTHRYTAFGQMIGTTSSASRFKFSSKERDASTGLMYYGYRFYAPQWQRWVSADPVSETSDLNLYRLVGNAPANHVDVRGLFIAPPGTDTSGLEELGACPFRIKDEVWNKFNNPEHMQQDPNFHYGHCVANCRISRECAGGRLLGWGGGWIKELVDQPKKWWSNQGAGFDGGDMDANREGRRRARKCPDQSCEDACKGTGG
jgi:RHS repeat-associated protein